MTWDAVAHSASHTHIDLFAGCGGLALGLHRAGWEGSFALERDPMAFETLSRNMLEADAPYRGFTSWPDWLPRQSMEIGAFLDNSTFRCRLAELRGDIALVAGGPPCQGFSVGGRRDGTDERNNLVFRFLDFVEVVQSDMVLIENVEGIAKKFLSKPTEAGKSVVDEILNLLAEMHYTATFRVVDASDFGVPQSRRRVIIVAAKQDLCKGLNLTHLLAETISKARLALLAKWGLPSNRAIVVREAIADLDGDRKVVCPDSPKFNAGTYTGEISGYAELMRAGAKAADVPNSHRFTKHGSQISRLYELAHATQPRGRLSKAFLLQNNTQKDKKVLLDPAAVASTITTHPDEFIHYAHPRNITVREMARLQSFPDNFKFYGRYTINGPRRRFDVARCSQVGNAVPPLMAEGIGLALKSILAVLRGEPKASTNEPSPNCLPVQLPLGFAC